jgi:N-formylglutamate amidohydrolase
MPPPAIGVAPIVLGDCHGRSAAGWITREARRLAERQGFAAAANEPFAGGHVVERHWSSARGHSRAADRDRPALLSRRRVAERGGFDAVARLMEVLALELGEALLGRQFATAAE